MLSLRYNVLKESINVLLFLEAGHVGEIAQVVGQGVGDPFGHPDR